MKINFLKLLLIILDASKRGTKRARNESSSEKLTKEKPPDPAALLPEIGTNHNESGGIIDCDAEHSFNSAVEEAVNTLLALTKQDNNDENKPSQQPTIKEAEAVEKKEQDISRIRKGWSLEDCGAVSIGELYLMVKIITK